MNCYFTINNMILTVVVICAKSFIGEFNFIAGYISNL